MPNRDSSDHNNQPTTPRRSQRLLHHNHNSISEPQHPKTGESSKSRKNEVCSSNPSRFRRGFKDSSKKSSNNKSDSIGLRRSPRLNNGVVGFPCLRRSPRLSNQKVPMNDHNDYPNKSHNVSVDSENLTPGPRKSTRVKGRNASIDPSKRGKTKENSLEASVGNCEKMTRGVSVTHEGVTGEGREGEARNGDRIEVGVKRKRKRKRKRGEGGEQIVKGWTKEQEVALQRAYFAAKPSPHFWKKVSKLVPGKSQQDCFDRIHRDHITPPQTLPRSRAKTIKSSPPQHFSISASKLLEPVDRKVRRSNFLKPKNYITRKSVEKLLQRHLKVDQDREGDIFSVLEPNIDFSTNAFQPTDALSTPKQQKENQGLLQSCNETSSSSHKKSLSRFSSSCLTDLVSPPVLKQVKNRVVHEKYINQLRCREARRRAASARIQMPITRKIIGEGSSIQKRDVVKAAKIALVSEARDAIKKFEQSQVNFMSITCSSDEDNDDGIGVESADKEAEYESQ